MKILPYVYVCIHKRTKQFYIGSRTGNKVSSSQDLGLIYKTSSKNVKPIFNEFDYYVYAEFFIASDAWKFEQQLIEENITNDLLINTSYFKKDSLVFSTTGRSRTTQEKHAISIKKIGVPRPIGLLEKVRSCKKPALPVKNFSYICKFCKTPFIKAHTDNLKKLPQFCSYNCSNTFIAQTRISKQYYCGDCNKTISGTSNWTRHLESKPHINNINQQN